MFHHGYQPMGEDHYQLPPRELERMSKVQRRTISGIMFIWGVAFAGVYLLPGLFLLHAKDLSRDLCPGPQVAQGIAVDYSLGDFSFTAAKSIDIAWDITVGRGGQVILLWIARKVYVATLNYVMERSTVTYDFYVAIAFDAKPWDTILALTNHIRSTRRYLVKTAFIFYSVLYIALFPTLVAAMTGYANFTSPYVVFGDESMIPYDEFIRRQQILKNETGIYSFYNGTTYPSDFQLTACFDHPSGRYSYGFSTLIWKIICGLHMVWIFGMYNLWLDAIRKSQLCQAGCRVGKYRAIIDIGEALKEDLGPNTCAYSGDELRAALVFNNTRFGYYQTRKVTPVHIGVSSPENRELYPIDLDAAKGELFGRQDDRDIFEPRSNESNIRPWGR